MTVTPQKIADILRCTGVHAYVSADGQEVYAHNGTLADISAEWYVIVVRPAEGPEAAEAEQRRAALQVWDDCLLRWRQREPGAYCPLAS